MSKLKVNQKAVTEEAAQQLVKACPFSAITYEDNSLEVSDACRLCGICVKLAPEIMAIEAEKKTLDKGAWRGVAVFAEMVGDALHCVVPELVGKARQLAAVTRQPVLALLVGDKTAEAARQLVSLGVDRICVYENPAFGFYSSDPFTAAFADFIEKKKPSAVLVGATGVGRALAPRVAAKFETGITADCTKLEMKENTDLVQIRPAFGGNIMAQIVTENSRPQLCTVRYKVFDPASPVPHPTGQIEEMSLAPGELGSRVELLSMTVTPPESDITEAKRIVAVGRGLKSAADLELAQKLADAIDARLACTRPMVEAGLFGQKRQIGLSGRTVKPQLIITLGISGSVQFAAGMKGSARIIAVNSDKNAPIFDIAHDGIVGDLYEIVPRLIAVCGEGRA
ncbi:MAG TPA: electron transfer flavoprotein subunit alpha [Candidatus Acidoferrum sp.]|nr:electron transfer flavoprotein subunit alpha [Candidatus Acidoferrum sp.]